eukprot:10276651-Ditylum_brightwellii.AAC.1
METGMRISIFFSMVAAHLSATLSLTERCAIMGLSFDKSISYVIGMAAVADFLEYLSCHVFVPKKFNQRLPSRKLSQGYVFFPLELSGKIIKQFVELLVYTDWGLALQQRWRGRSPMFSMYTHALHWKYSTN